MFDVINAARGRGVVQCEVHPCESVNCTNGGTCVLSDRPDIFRCDCPPEFKGDFCEVMIPNSCMLGTDNCHPQSQCVFDYATETFECRCYLKPTSRSGRLCLDSRSLLLRFQSARDYPFRCSYSFRYNKVQGQQLRIVSLHWSHFPDCRQSHHLRSSEERSCAVY